MKLGTVDHLPRFPSLEHDATLKHHRDVLAVLDIREDTSGTALFSSYLLSLVGTVPFSTRA